MDLLSNLRDLFWYRDRPVLGIDIDKAYIKGIILMTSDDIQQPVAIAHTFRVKTPEDAYKDGQLTNPLAISLAIEKACRIHGIKNSVIATAIEDSDVLFHKSSVVYTPDKVIMYNRIKAIADEAIPFIKEGIMLDYILDKTDETVADEKIDVSIYSCKTHNISRIEEIFLNNTVNPLEIVDIKSFCIERALFSLLLPAEKEKTVAYLDIHRDYLVIDVFKEEHHVVSRELKVGWQAIVESLVRTGIAEIVAADIVQMKLDSVNTYDDNVLYAFINQLVSIFKQSTALSNEDIQTFVIGGECILGQAKIAALLAKQLNKSCVVANPFCNVEGYADHINQDNLHKYASEFVVAFGLAMRSRHV